MKNVHLNMEWDEAFKLAFSVLMLGTSIIITIVAVHSKDIRVSRLSLLPYYAIICESLFMVIYYICFSLFSI